MDDPLNNVIDGTKELIKKITNIDINTKNNNDITTLNYDKTNYGKPDCLDNTDCNTINECQTDLCVCGDGGSCYG